MSATGGKIVHTPDSTGGNVGTVTITRLDGTVVHRQEMVLGDPENDLQRAGVTKYGELVENDDQFVLNRHLQEQVAIAALDQGVAAFARRANERFSTTDRRGGTGRGSTR